MKMKFKQLNKGILSVMISAVILSSSAVIKTLPVCAVDSALLDKNDNITQIVDDNKTDDSQLINVDGVNIPLTNENTAPLQVNGADESEGETVSSFDMLQEDAEHDIGESDSETFLPSADADKEYSVYVQANPIPDVYIDNKLYSYSHCTGTITITINGDVITENAVGTDIKAKPGDKILVSAIPKERYTSDKYTDGVNYGLGYVKYKDHNENDYKSVVGTSEGDFYITMPEHDIDISATFGWIHSAFVSATSSTSVNFICDVSGDGDYYLDDLHNEEKGEYTSEVSGRGKDNRFADYYSVWARVSAVPGALDEENPNKEDYVWVKGILTENGTTANITVDVNNIRYNDSNTDKEEKDGGTVNIPGYKDGKPLYIKVPEHG